MDPARDHRAAATWARSVLADETTVILDAETTGLLDARAVEVAVVDAHGRVLMQSLVDPEIPSEPSAAAVHGITSDELAGPPRFVDLVPELEQLLAGRRVVCWNAEFDQGVISAELARAGVEEPSGIRWECAMSHHAAWVGETSEYGYRRHSLRAAHRAVGDCEAVLDRLNQMAADRCSQGGGRGLFQDVA